MKLEEREYGVLAFVDDNGRVWAQCVKSSPNSPDYGIEGPLSGFVSDEGTFTMESERKFQDWLNDHLLGEELFFVKDKETALDFAKRIAEAACQILKDRKNIITKKNDTNHAVTLAALVKSSKKACRIST